MSDVAFFQTAMGRTFYERTVPALVQELARLNGLLERLIEGEPVSPTPSGEGAGREEQAP